MQNGKNQDNVPSKMSARELRQLRREQLRLKSTGVGLSISVKPSSRSDVSAESSKKGNKKIFFSNLDHDDNIDDQAESDIKSDNDSEKMNVRNRRKTDHHEEEHDSDDDAVEEVGQKSAREQAEEQRLREFATARVASVDARSKKRKRKQVAGITKSGRTKGVDEAVDQLDEKFFEDLEAEIEETKHKKEKKEKPKGRHSTFVVESSNMDDFSKPTPVGHGIELVVLRDVPQTAAQTMPLFGNTAESSDEVMLFSRGRIIDGSDPSAKQKKNKTSKEKDAGWKRSRKMNTLLVPGARSAVVKGRGRSAAQFVLKSK